MYQYKTPTIMCHNLTALMPVMPRCTKTPFLHVLTEIQSLQWKLSLF